MAAVTTKHDASRALAGSDIVFLGEFEVVNDADVKTLTEFLKAQVRKNAKLRVFVTQRKQQRKR